MSDSSIHLLDYIGFPGIEASDLVPQISNMETGSIDLIVNSPGGNVFDGWAIANALRGHPARVNAQVTGLAASIAAVIVAAAADTVHASRGAMFMVHRPHTMIMGDSSELRKEAELLDKVEGEISAVFEKRMGLSSQKVRGMLAEETWFTAQEALDVGLVDKLHGEEEAKDQNWARNYYRHKSLAFAKATQVESRVSEETEENLQARLAALSRILKA